jgi:hypothetical protein
VKATKNLYILKQCSTECEGAVHVIKRIQPSNCRSMDSNSRVLDVSGGFAFSCRIYSHRSSFTREMCLSTFSPLAAQPPPALPPPQARRPPVCSPPQLGVCTLCDLYERPVQGRHTHSASLVPKCPHELHCRRLLRTPWPHLQRVRRRGEDASSGERATVVARRGRLQNCVASSPPNHRRLRYGAVAPSASDPPPSAVTR